MLDFGLAKAFAAPAGAGPITSPTRRTDGGGHGARHFGTWHRSSWKARRPTRGGHLRAGRGLYEMSPGARAFEGSTRASLVSAILRDEPRSVSQLQPMAPAPLDRLVRKCLAKDPEDRWQSARDVGSELEWVRGSGSGTATSTTPRPKHGRAGWVAAAVLASQWPLSCCCARALRTHLRRERSASRCRRRKPDESSSLLSRPRFSRCPQTAGGSPFARRLRPPPLPSTAPRSSFGPSTRRIPRPFPERRARSRHSGRQTARRFAFFADGKLKKVPLSGGPPSTICDVARGGTGTWGRDGVIVFFRVELRQDRPGAGSPATGGKPVAGDAPRRRAERTMALGGPFSFPTAGTSSS